MRVLPNLFVLFNLGKHHQNAVSPEISSTSLNLFATKEAVSTKRDETIQDLLSVVSKVGQVGSMATEEERMMLEELSKVAVPLSDAKPARVPLIGEHKLLYSASAGPSSGKLGNFVGKVTQLFEEGEIFYNRVNFGPLRIALKAKREIKSDNVIKVSFLETKVSLFGKTLVEKQAGGGEFKCWVECPMTLQDHTSFGMNLYLCL